MTKNHWIFNDKIYEPDEKSFGFIYIIEFSDGSYYIGKKQRKMRRGKKKGRINWVENWMSYKSSSTAVKLKIDIGIHKVKYSVLEECYGKGELSYKEVYYQFKMDVLSDPKSLNENINGKFFRKNVEKY